MRKNRKKISYCTRDAPLLYILTAALLSALNKRCMTSPYDSWRDITSEGHATRDFVGASNLDGVNFAELAST
jgi:hypothetical protein